MPKDRQCIAEGCDGEIDFNKNIPTTVKYDGKDVGVLVHPCNQCGKLYWSGGDPVKT